MVQHQLPVGIRDTTYRWGGGGGRIYKYLGYDKSSFKGIQRETFKKIEEHADIAYQMVRDLAIEEALQI